MEIAEVAERLEKSAGAVGVAPGRDRPARGDREGTGRRAHVAAGKRGALGLSGRVPRRVDAATKTGLLELIDGVVAEGWDHRRACRVLGLKESRAWRWRIRRDGLVAAREKRMEYHRIHKPPETRDVD
jgi:hypothetical protein